MGMSMLGAMRRRHHFERSEGSGQRCRFGRSEGSTGGGKGQMTVELAVAMPVLVIVAVIAVNAMSFFADCAIFDRVAHQAVRAHAASPAYGQGSGQSCALVEQEIEQALDQSNLDVSVTCGTITGDFESFTATVEYHPTLFGMGLRSEVLGVSLPTLVHSTTYVVDVYKPGVVV